MAIGEYPLGVTPLAAEAGAAAPPAAPPFDNSSQVFSSPSRMKQGGFTELIPNLLITTLATAVVARGGWMPQPQVKKPVQVDNYPNLLETTLGAVTPAPFLPVDTPDVPVRNPPQVDQPQNLLNTLLKTSSVFRPANIPQVDPKRAVQAENQPNLLPLAVVVTNPVGSQGSESAPVIRYVQPAEQHRNLLTSTLQAASVFRPQTVPLVQPKRPVQVDQQANLLPLAPAAATAIALPLGLPVDTAQLQPKFAVQVDAYPNTLIHGIPDPVTGHGCWWADGETPTADSTNFTADSACTRTTGVTGGWEPFFRLEQEAIRRRARLEEEERRKEAERELLDEIDAEIARRLHRDMAAQEELEDLARLREIVRQYPAMDGANERVQRAFLAAREAQTFSRLQALQREFMRMQEEEEIAILMILLNEQ